LTPGNRALDALKAMAKGNFRHVPIVDNGKLVGVVSRGDFRGMEFEEFDWDRSHLRNAITPNREVSSIISDQSPLALSADETVRRACAAMRLSGSGSVLVVDLQRQLIGIFTGRDAVRALSESDDASTKLLRVAMKPEPVTITPESHAIDALRTMSDRGFRHLPVVENGRIYGVISRSDFTGVEIDRLDEDEHLAECIW
jgi:CBS domain-containing protein